MEFGEYLRELRGKVEISLRELAKRAKVSVGYLSQVECGKREPPTPAILRKLAPILGVTTRELMAKAGDLEEGVVVETEKKAVERAFEFLLHHPRLQNKAYFKTLPLIAKKAVIEFYEAQSGQQLLFPLKLMELVAFKKIAQEKPPDTSAWGESEWEPPTQITIPGQGTIDLKDTLLDLSQAAQFLGCSKAHIKKLVNESSLPHVAELGGKLIFSERALDAWAKARVFKNSK